MSSSPTSSHRKRPSLSQRFSWSRRPSRNVLEPAEDEKPVAVLRIQIIGCKELRAADINGKSDPYVAVTVARQRQKTPVSPKTLAPTYDPKSATFDFPLYATVLQKVGSLLELVVWDKDVIGKDYLGELAVPAGEWFAHNGGIKPFASPGNKDFWLPLVSTRAPGRAERESKGQVHLKLGFINAPGTADTNFDDIFNTYFLSGRSLLSVSPTQGFATLGENAVVNADDGSDGADEPGSPHSPRLSQDSRRTLSMSERSFSRIKNLQQNSPQVLGRKLPSFRLNWSDTKIDYSFGTHNDVEGVLLLEIKDASNLPKLGGGLSKLVGGSWDMDPFVMVHTNHKAFRTRVVRHSLNPEWNEKIMFHVRKSDLNEDTKIHLTVRDWDKITSDDYVGDAAIDLVDLIAQAPTPDAETGLFKTDHDLGNAMKDLVLPLELPKDVRLDGNTRPSIHVRVKYEPHAYFRQRFWRQSLQAFDKNRNGTFSQPELMEFLESMGLALTPATVARFFEQCGKTEISLDEAIQSLEESIGSRLDHNQQPSWAHITEKTKPAEPTILVTAPSSVKRDVAPQVDAASTQLVIQQAALPAPSAPSEPVVPTLPPHVILLPVDEPPTTSSSTLPSLVPSVSPTTKPDAPTPLEVNKPAAGVAPEPVPAADGPEVEVKPKVLPVVDEPKMDLTPEKSQAATRLKAILLPQEHQVAVEVGPQHVSESKDYASTPEGTDIDATHLQPEESAPSETSEQSVPVLHDADQAPEHVEPTTCSSTKAQVEKPSTHAIFEISGHAITHWGEHVYVVGSLIELGSWNPMKAIKLSSDEYPIWKASVQLPVDTPFEYKYIRIVPGQQVFWEETPFVNRDARTPVVGTFEVHDAWY